MRFYVIGLLFLLISCGQEFEHSPWETKVPEEHADTIQKNLRKVAALQLGDEYKVALIADVHNALKDLNEVISQLNKRGDIAFAIILGDITDEGLKKEYMLFIETMDNLKVPYLPVIGNHDASSYGKEIYKELFGDYNYYITINNTKYIFYNNNYNQFSGTPDYTWLTQQTSGHESRDYTILAGHQHPTSKALTKKQQAELLNFILNNGVTHHLAGHNHTFSLVTRNGVHFYKAATAEGVQYGIMTVTSQQITFQNCKKSC